MKRLLLFLVASLSLWGQVATALSSEVEDVQDVIIPKEPGILTDAEMTRHDIIYNIKVNKGGEYYVIFRVLPAWINDSYFTTFEIYLDGKRVGTVAPRKHGWQNLSMDEATTLNLTEGKHTITMVIPYGTPINVEDLYIVASNPEKYASSPEYDRFLEECKSHNSVDFMEMVAEQQVPLNTSGKFENLTMKYTFYTFLDLKENDELSIYSASDIYHAVDLVYWGYDRQVHNAWNKTWKFSCS